MKRLAGMACAWACALAAGAATLVSPDGTIKVEIRTEGRPAWSVERKGAEIIKPSALGLAFARQAPFGEMELKKSTERKIDREWSTRLYKKEKVRDRANEVKLELREKSAPHRRLDLYFRAYDGAVAFRYGIPEQPGFEIFTLTGEQTQWTFAGDPLGWLTTYGSHRTSQEQPFRNRSLRSVPAKEVIGMPAIFSARGQMVALCEADLTDWAGLFFRNATGPAAGKSILSASLAEIESSGCHGECVISYAPRVSPWRVAIFGDSELELLANNDVILNLNPPPEGGEEAFSWVKPGATSWDWWYESNNTLSTERTKELVDMAAKMGWPYHTIDGGWYGPARRPNRGPGVKIAPNPKFDLDGIIKYAAGKGVGIWVWCYWTALEENGVEEVFADFERRGIKGVKIDFMDRQDQWMVRWYEKVVRIAAKHKLMINFHGAYKPTGMNRTWPNQVTREGILGNEMTKFNGQVDAAHCATLPFTRFLLGPGDFTPGSFGNVHSWQFTPQSARGHRYGDATDTRLIGAEEIGTRAHALALCVAYDSPLTTLCDWPQRYLGAKGAEALENLPTVWRSTTPLWGSIGKNYCVAREAFDGRFYVAALGTEPEKATLDFGFLPEGKEYEAAMHLDGDNACKDAKDLKTVRRRVKKGDRAEISIACEGGAVVVLTPVK